MQTNRANGTNMIDLVQGKPPGLNLVSLDAGGSPNHKVEAAAVQVGAYCLVTPDQGKAEAAVRRSIDLLKQQRTEGHMLIEPLTDSHAAIWLRAMTGLMFFAMKLAPRGGAFAILYDLVQEWHAMHVELLSLGLVPRGPLAGTVLLPCGRKAGATAEEQRVGVKLAGIGGEPGNQVRDVYLQMMTGARVQPVGRHYWDLDKERADTAAGPITKLILAKGGFDPPKLGRAPALLSALTVHQYADGHQAIFEEGLPGVSDPALACRVRYSTGEWSFLPGGDIDLPGARRVLVVPKAGARESR